MFVMLILMLLSSSGQVLLVGLCTQKGFVQSSYQALILCVQKVDYTKEGENVDKFRKDFGPSRWMTLPGILWERTTSEVLTMEYCPGVKIKSICELDKLGVERKQLAMFEVESYLQKILTYGFFHEKVCAGNSLVVFSVFTCHDSHGR